MTTVLSEAMRAGDNLEIYLVDLMTKAMKKKPEDTRLSIDMSETIC